MIDPQIAITDSDNNLKFLRDTFSDIDEKIYKHIPSEGKWSIQLILEHLSITEGVMIFLSKGPTTPTDRDPSKNIFIVRDAFANHGLQLPAPDVVTPKGEDKSVEAFLSSVEKSRQSYIKHISGNEWNEILDAFSHPLTGTMTRMEWLYFNIYHVERHIHQIKMILQSKAT